MTTKAVRSPWLAAALVLGACGRQALWSPHSDAASVDGAHDSRADGGVGSGCGKPLPATQPKTVPGQATGYLQYTVMTTGATLAGPEPQKAGPRSFWVRVPADYDPNRPYRVVYIGQGCGTPGMANVDTYRLFNTVQGGDEEAIYVAVDLPFGADSCYDTQSGTASEEWEAFELFHTVVDHTYCVDNDRVFATGFSSGGTLAEMWGCYFAGDGAHPANGALDGGASAAAPRQFAPAYHVRGHAAQSGGEPPNEPPCNGPVAALWIHDDEDPVNPLADEQAARERVLQRNGCAGSPTSPWHPEIPTLGSVCVQYTACPLDYPVVFCTTEEGTQSDDDFRAIPAFTLFTQQVGIRP